MIKILLYNINYGGRQSKKLNKNLKARWTILSKIIKDINPDMTIILEAWDWKKNHELKEFSQKCNFKYYYLSKSNTKHHIGLMSKIKPLKILKHKEGFHHSVLQSQFIYKNINFDLFGIHLSPKTENIRLKEIKKLLKLIKNNPNQIITGDFNSLASQDNYDKKRLLKHLQKLKIKKFGINKIEQKVIPTILKNKLIDITKKYYPSKNITYTVPTKMCKDIDHLEKMRLDYFFISPSLKRNIKNIKIIRNSETNLASDHFPILLTLK